MPLPRNGGVSETVGEEDGGGCQVFTIKWLPGVLPLGMYLPPGPTLATDDSVETTIVS